MRKLFQQIQDRLNIGYISNNGELCIEKGECLFFIHIPKTAGTSFREMLYQKFNQEKIYPNIFRIKDNSGRYPNFKEVRKEIKKDKESFEKIKLVTGHYPYLLNQFLPFEKVRCITFLREPISRTVSHLNHLKNRRADCYNLSLEEIFELYFYQVTNVQIRYFIEKKGKKVISTEDVDFAKKNLLKCDFVGITEDFENSIRLIEQKFACKFDGILRKNTSANKEKTQNINEAFLNKIKEANKIDLHFYEFANNIIYKQYNN